MKLWRMHAEVSAMNILLWVWHLARHFPFRARHAAAYSMAQNAASQGRPTFLWRLNKHHACTFQSRAVLLYMFETAYLCHAPYSIVCMSTYTIICVWRECNQTRRSENRGHSLYDIEVQIYVSCKQQRYKLENHMKDPAAACMWVCKWWWWWW